MFTLEEIYETINDCTIEELVDIQKKCDDLIEHKREEIETIVKEKIGEFLCQIQIKYDVNFLYEGSRFDFYKFEIIKGI